MVSANIKLCDENSCTGCGACVNICPVKAITMKENNKKFLYPSIDFSVCISCGACMAVCPCLSVKDKVEEYQPHVYACWSNEKEVKWKSSSGGMFSSLAQYVLSENGVVFGAMYDKNMHLCHVGISSVDDLDKLRRSKYVQSDIGDSFQQIKKLLISGVKVLFVGTPCQVLGLKSFLKKDFDNLLTCDLVCHGVPSPGLFVDYIKRLNIPVASLNFRDKRKGWKNNIIVATDTFGKEHHLKGAQKSFYYVFIKGLSLRPSCFQCPAIGLLRNSDITLADFWGIEKNPQFKYKEQITSGVSLVLFHNEKFLSLLNKLNISFQKMNINDALSGNPHIIYSCKKPQNYDMFWEDYEDHSYSYLEKKYVRLTNRGKFVNFLKDYAPKIVLNVFRKYL